MKITEAIAQHITEVYIGGNWTEVDIKNTLEDISLREGIRLTDASPNTIAGIVYHLNFYNERMFERLQGTNTLINAMNGFDMPLIKNENDWETLKKGLFLSANKLAEAVKIFPEEKLFLPIIAGQSTAYKSLHGIAEHAYYHLGQIFILKTLIKKEDE